MEITTGSHFAIAVNYQAGNNCQALPAFTNTQEQLAYQKLKILKIGDFNTIICEILRRLEANYYSWDLL